MKREEKRKEKVFECGCWWRKRGGDACDYIGCGGGDGVCDSDVFVGEVVIVIVIDE